MLNSQFETEGIECSFSATVATPLMYGSFLWRNALSSSGLASSVLTSEGILHINTLHEGTLLDYSTKYEMSAAIVYHRSSGIFKSPNTLHAQVILNS